MRMETINLDLDAETGLLVHTLVIALGNMLHIDPDDDDAFYALFGGVCAVLAKFRKLPDDAEYTLLDWCEEIISFAVHCVETVKKGEGMVVVQEDERDSNA